MTPNYTDKDYRDVFTKRADYQRSHPSHRRRTLLGRDEQNFAAGHLAHVRGHLAAEADIAGGSPPQDHLLTISQAAAELGVSRQRVFQLVQRGQLVSHRVGPIHLIERTSVELRLADHPKTGGEQT